MTSSVGRSSIGSSIGLRASILVVEMTHYAGYSQLATATEAAGESPDRVAVTQPAIAHWCSALWRSRPAHCPHVTIANCTYHATRCMPRDSLYFLMHVGGASALAETRTR